MSNKRYIHTHFLIEQVVKKATKHPNFDDLVREIKIKFPSISEVAIKSAVDDLLEDEVIVRDQRFGRTVYVTKESVKMETLCLLCHNPTDDMHDEFCPQCFTFIKNLPHMSLVTTRGTINYYYPNIEQDRIILVKLMRIRNKISNGEIPVSRTA